MKQKRRHDRGGGQSEARIEVLSRLIGESLGVLGLFDGRDWLPACGFDSRLLVYAGVG